MTIDENLKQFLRVEVRDNGCGIKEEDQQRLFRLFGYLEESSAMNTQGIGLGLYITQMIVAQFGGKVDCKSQLGIGSTFSLTFELLEENRNQGQGHRQLNAQRFWDGQKMKITAIQSEQVLDRPIFNQPAQICHMLQIGEPQHDETESDLGLLEGERQQIENSLYLLP